MEVNQVKRRGLITKAAWRRGIDLVLINHATAFQIFGQDAELCRQLNQRHFRKISAVSLASIRQVSALCRHSSFGLVVGIGQLPLESSLHSCGGTSPPALSFPTVGHRACRPPCRACWHFPQSGETQPRPNPSARRTCGFSRWRDTSRRCKESSTHSLRRKEGAQCISGGFWGTTR